MDADAVKQEEPVPAGDADADQRKEQVRHTGVYVHPPAWASAVFYNIAQLHFGLLCVVPCLQPPGCSQHAPTQRIAQSWSIMSRTAANLACMMVCHVTHYSKVSMQYMRPFLLWRNTRVTHRSSHACRTSQQVTLPKPRRRCQRAWTH